MSGGLLLVDVEGASLEVEKRIWRGLSSRRALENVVVGVARVALVIKASSA